MDTAYKDIPMTEVPDEIQRLYTVTDSERVVAILRAQPLLVPLLLEASLQLQTYFPGARLSLQWLTDPEEPLDRLFVGVTPDLPVEQAIHQLRQFDRGWWLENGPRALGKVCIDLEF
jgi:hypothetical protein